MPIGQEEKGPAPQTYGERAVGLSFNPSGDAAVHSCKVGFSVLIDQLHELRDDASRNGRSEQARLASIAITEAQGAQMWAVKAITWRE